MQPKSRMRTQSIISDPEPYVPIQDKPAPEPPKTDWEKLGQSSGYPKVNEYIEGRKEYFRRYLPGGEPIEELKTADERNHAWGQAVTVIKELEALQLTIAAHTRKK